MHEKALLSGVAIALTFAAFFPYVRSILRGETKPHVFSWLLWGAATATVFAAQLADGGGAGAWPIGVSGLITMSVAGLAFTRRADITITRLDWGFLAFGLMALPAWVFTSDPLWAVIILTMVDCAGFGPTFRKTWARPHDEGLAFYVLIGVRNLVAIAALENYSVTTLLFPAVMAGAGFAFVAMVMWRRATIGGDRR